MALASYAAGVNPQQIAGATGAPVVAQDGEQKSTSPADAVGQIISNALTDPATSAQAAATGVVSGIGSSIGAAVLGPITEVAVTVVLAAAGTVLIILAVAKLADTGARKAISSDNGQLALAAATKGVAGGAPTGK